MNKKYLVISLISLLLSNFNLVTCSKAEINDDDDFHIINKNIDYVITLSTSFLAIILFFISVRAYLIDKRGRLLFVLGAFFLFALKGIILVINDLFFQGLLVGPLYVFLAPFINVLVPVSRLLDFIALLLLFFGLIRK